MSIAQAGKVLFRRIGGRVVPISAGQHAGRAAIGGATGAIGGKAHANEANQKRIKRLQKNMKQNTVEAKKFTKKSGFGGVNVITKPDDLKGITFNDGTSANQRGIRRMARRMGSGKNAAAAKFKGQEFIFASEKVNKKILGHEIGHIKHLRKGKHRGPTSRGFLGDITGGTVDKEKKAWKLSPVKTKKNDPVRKGALGTYKQSRDSVRAGTALGVLSSVAYSIVKGR